eukprot:601606-Hanusia_phi.AAC.1
MIGWRATATSLSGMTGGCRGTTVRPRSVCGGAHGALAGTVNRKGPKSEPGGSESVTRPVRSGPQGPRGPGPPGRAAGIDLGQSVSRPSSRFNGCPGLGSHGFQSSTVWDHVALSMSLGHLPGRRAVSHRPAPYPAPVTAALSDRKVRTASQDHPPG